MMAVRLISIAILSFLLTPRRVVWVGTECTEVFSLKEVM